MRLLTTAAMALALTGAAAAAQAQQQGDQHPDHHQGGGQSHGQGGQPHVQGGQPHFQAPTGGQHNFGAAQGGAQYYRGPQGGHVNAQGGQSWQQQWQNQARHQTPTGQSWQQRWQGEARHQTPTGQSWQQQWQGQARHQTPSGQSWQQQWQNQAGNERFHGQAGGRDRYWNGERGARPGFGFQDHGLRGRDEGRAYFSARAFAPRYHAERRFRFYGYRDYPRGWYVRTWNFGDFLPWGWYAPEYYLDWADYGLPPPPVGAEWIAEGPDAVLVDIWTGEVLSVYQGVFWWNGY